MTVVPLGINIDTSTAVDGVRNLDALVPAAERVERASDKMVAAILADLKAVNEQGFARMSASAEASLVALNKLGQAKPTERLPTDVQRSADAFDRLKASIDPVFRAELQLAQAQKTLDAAMKAGRVTAAEAAATMRQYEAAMAGAGRGAPQLQNTAFQIQDIFTQINAGTSASTALAMQLPQLLGGFGALGAVLGAVVAIGAPLASSFFTSGAEAKTLKDHVNDLEGAVSALSDANERALVPLEELRAKYGEMTAEVIANNKAMMSLRLSEAQSQARSAADSLTGGRINDYVKARGIYNAAAMAGDPEGDLKWLAGPLETYGKNLREIEAQLKLTDAQAMTFAQTLQALGSAQTPEQMLAALTSIRDQISASEAGFAGLTGQGQEFGNAVISATQSVIDLGVETERAEQAADGVRRSAEEIDFANATRSASLLTSELVAAQRAIAGLMASQAAAMRSAELRLKYAGDPVGLAGATARMNAEDIIRNLPGKEKDDRAPFVDGQEARARALAEAEAKATDAERIAREAARISGGGRKGRGGGGGGKSEAAKEAENTARALEREKETRDRVIAGLRFEAEMVGKSDVARRIANETRKAGVDLYSEEGQQIADLVERINSAEEAADRFGRIQEYAAQTGADLFTSAIQGADSFKEALGGVIAQLGQMAAQQAFMTLFMGQGGKGGGIFQSILGGVLGGGMPVTGSFANGTPAVYATGTSNHPGGPAIINDRGGEIVDLPSGARVYPHDVSMRMAQAQSGASSTHVTVGVEVDGEGSIRAFVKDQVTKSEKRAVRTSVGAVRKGDATSHNFWKR